MRFFAVFARIGLCGALVFPALLHAEKFEFKYHQGDKFRLLSTTEEEVLLNGKIVQRSTILNRMASEVAEIRGGKATLNAVFNVAEETRNDDRTKRFSWGEEYSSVFTQDKLGKMTIAQKYFMPSARDLPLFPDRELNTGESWASQGDEVFDLRRTFEINEPYSVPFRATNTFVGERMWKQKKYKTLQVRYNLYKNNDDGFENEPRTYLLQPSQKAEVLKDIKLAIRKITGTSRQLLYWDEALGQIAAAEDVFEIHFELNTGEKWTFRGKTVSEIIEAGTMDKEEIARDIQETLDALNMNDVTVKVVDKGISISLDNIQFAADSADLLPSEKEKLNKLTEILKRYNERDILVAGHTAEAGPGEAARVKLSEQRAGAVADYFIKNKVRTPQRIITQGYGSSRPAADNTTEEGRRKNRRVEITILEN